MENNHDLFRTSSDCEIVSSRVFNASVASLFEAWSVPNHLANWWGPKGFTNTFNEFDFRVGGKWSFVMHGPDRGNYPNECEFIKIIPNELIAWNHLSKPKFRIVVLFKSLSKDMTEIVFKMQFDSPNECDKLKTYVPSKNEENFDKLENELILMLER